MKKNKNENRTLAIIVICLFVLIIILTILFQFILPNIKKNEKVQSDSFVPNDDITEEGMYKPSENEWITLQLSR